ncbi:uncharacterized protein METZ01_LOCUS175853, partial [marine metagenome]
MYDFSFAALVILCTLHYSIGYRIRPAVTGHIPINA